MKIKTKTNETLLKNLKRNSNKKAVVLLSGGVDSTATAFLLKHKGYEVYPLFIDYGQNANIAEKFIANKISEKMNLQKIKIIKTDIYKQFQGIKMCDGDVEKADDAWVSGRNTLFMMIAGIYAERINADGISLGYMLEDNFVFGDNDFFHHKEVENLLAKSFLRPFKVYMPIKHLNKSQLISLLRENELFDITTSCWNAKLDGKSISVCHQCANCLERDQLSKFSA